MSGKRRMFEAASDALIALLGLNRPLRFYRAFLGRINAVKTVQVRGTAMRFDANAEPHLLRAELLETKEPETLDWIDGFTAGDVLYDIGANVGVFSVYAALHRQCDVYAFEPEAKNHACLWANAHLNGLDERVKTLNLALHDRRAVEYPRMQGQESGAALHALGEPVDWRRQPLTPSGSQVVLAYALDDLVEQFGLPLPNHVKLDVDGNEARILAGGRRTLGNPALKSLMIEINENDRVLIAAIQGCGLQLARRTQAGQGEYADTYNMEFRR